MRIRYGWELALAALLVMEIVAFGAINPRMLDLNMLLFSTSDFICIGIVALPLTMVIVSGGIDISFGSTIGLCAIALGVLFQSGVPMPLAILLTLLLGALCGLINAGLIIYTKVNPLVITLGTLYLFAGSALLLSGMAGATGYEGIGGFPMAFTDFANLDVLGLPVPLIIFLICLLVFWLWLHKTHAGRNVFLIGQSPRVALYSAIPVNRTLCALYAMTGLASAVAAVLLVSYFGSARSDLGASFLMPAITAVVLGGANIYGGSGSIIGTAIAVLLVGYLQQGLQMAGVPNWIEGLPAELKQLSAPLLFGVSAIGWLTIILMAFMAWLLAKTAFGRSFYATGDNLQGARQLGVRTEAIRIVAFSLNGCMAALAGIVFASQIGFIPNQTGTGLEMKAIAACVLGGISLLGGSGAIIGAVLGAWFLTQIDSVLVLLRIPAWWNDFIAGMVLLAVLVFDGRLRCALERNLRRQKYARFMMPPPSVKPASSGKKREAA